MIFFFLFSLEFSRWEFPHQRFSFFFFFKQSIPALTLEISLWLFQIFFSVDNPNLPLSNLSPSFNYSAA